MKMMRCVLTVGTMLAVAGSPCYGIISASERSGTENQFRREASRFESINIECRTTLMEGTARFLRMVPLGRQSAQSTVVRGGIAKVAEGIERVYAGTPGRANGYAVMTALLRAEAAGHDPMLLAGLDRPFILLQKNVRGRVVNGFPVLEIQEGFLDSGLERWLDNRVKIVADGGSPPPPPPTLKIDYMADIQPVIDALANITHGIRLAQQLMDADNQERRYQRLLQERYAMQADMLKTAQGQGNGRWCHTVAVNGSLYVLGRSQFDSSETEEERKRRKHAVISIIVPPPPPPPPPDWAFLPLTWRDDDDEESTRKRWADYHKEVSEDANKGEGATWQLIEFKLND